MSWAGTKFAIYIVGRPLGAEKNKEKKMITNEEINNLVAAIENGKFDDIDPTKRVENDVLVSLLRKTLVFIEEQNLTCVAQSDYETIRDLADHVEMMTD